MQTFSAPMVYNKRTGKSILKSRMIDKYPKPQRILMYHTMPLVAGVMDHVARLVIPIMHHRAM